MIRGKENPVQWKDPTAKEAIQRVMREEVMRPVSEKSINSPTTMVNPADESPFEKLGSETIFEIERRIYHLRKRRKTGVNHVDYRDQVNFYRGLLVKARRG